VGCPCSAGDARSLRQLEVQRLSAGVLRQVGTRPGTERVRIEPFDAIELDLGLLFST
jgi:hypothetical protein